MSKKIKITKSINKVSTLATEGLFGSGNDYWRQTQQADCGGIHACSSCNYRTWRQHLVWMDWGHDMMSDVTHSTIITWHILSLCRHNRVYKDKLLKDLTQNIWTQSGNTPMTSQGAETQRESKDHRPIVMQGSRKTLRSVIRRVIQREHSLGGWPVHKNTNETLKNLWHL